MGTIYIRPLNPYQADPVPTELPASALDLVADALFFQFANNSIEISGDVGLSSQATNLSSDTSLSNGQESISLPIDEYLENYRPRKRYTGVYTPTNISASITVENSCVLHCTETDFNTSSGETLLSPTG